MRITYANAKVERYFSDFSQMQKKVPLDWIRSIKKHLNHLAAADCFGDFLKLGLGQPEQLTGYNPIRYSLRVSANARLIIEPNATQDTILICDEIQIKGVSDYHGSKENWYIP